jgi:hypothetical protein
MGGCQRKVGGDEDGGAAPVRAGGGADAGDGGERGYLRERREARIDRGVGGGGRGETQKEHGEEAGHDAEPIACPVAL